LPTSSLAVLLLEQGGASTPPWLAVRSLGKQFDCNGWGLGAVMGPPALLHELVTRWRPQHLYNYLGFLQAAMAEWLPSPQAAAYTRMRQVSIAGNRVRVRRCLQATLGYPVDAVRDGTCTSFMLFETPPAYSARGVEAFIADAINVAGVVLAPA